MKKIILFVIILLCLVPILTQAVDKQNQDVLLLSILDTIGGEYLEGDISANGLLFEEFLDEKELNFIGENIIKSIGLVGKETGINTYEHDEYYIKEAILDEEYKQLNYFGYDKDKNPLTIILSSYINEEKTKGETYLYINLIKKEQFFGINDIICRIENIFLSYDKKAEITTCLIGGFDGKFIENEVEERFINAIHNVNGKIVDVYKDQQMISYTAYTDYIENNILAGKDRINLNVAIRYNEYDNNTLIWIGTPIITSGY